MALTVLLKWVLVQRLSQVDGVVLTTSWLGLRKQVLCVYKAHVYMFVPAKCLLHTSCVLGRVGALFVCVALRRFVPSFVCRRDLLQHSFTLYGRSMHLKTVDYVQ